MKWLKTFLADFRDFWKSPRKLIVTIFLGVLLVLLVTNAGNFGSGGSTVDFTEVLDKTAITVAGQDRTFRECAFYIGYEEGLVDEQARIYNPDKPDKYWNLHIDGVFVRISARNAAAQMAVHDEIFYQMAVEEGITLDEDDLKQLKYSEEDYWADLTDRDGQEGLAVSEEEINATMERVALAQKYQAIYAALQNAGYEDYDFSGDAYEAFLEDHDYSINEQLWKKLTFGSITLSY